jgi:polysaccharide export outer membrane protein
MKEKLLYSVSVLVVILLINTLCMAQEYKIGSDDVLTISFWQQPELNTTVKVTTNGTINIPVIGQVTAAGLTPSELSKKIVSKMSLFNKGVSQASVVVATYGSKSLYITGHVLQPGKFAFESMPSLWKAILEAGGPAETAMLSQIQIIRDGQQGQKTITVDLNKYLQEGNAADMPKLYPGDTIHVPGIRADTNLGGSESTGGGVTTTTVTENTIYIYGQIARPGGYQFTQDMNLLEAIIIAGGPTQLAELEEVKVITKGFHYSTVATIDLEQYSNEGVPAPFMLKPGDTIFIPQKNANSFFSFFQQGIVYDILRMVITISTSVILYNLIRN